MSRREASWGAQRPRIESVPPSDSTVGPEAVQLAAEAGLFLDPWQAHVLECMLALRDGRWAAFEAAIVVPRQNGKNSILEARELAGLFLLGERLIIHSAHQFDTSLEAFRRILFLIETTTSFTVALRASRMLTARRGSSCGTASGSGSGPGRSRAAVVSRVTA